MKTFTEARKQLESNKITCRELVQNHIGRIEENSDLNVFISVYNERALEKADAVDEKLKQGNAGKLAGMVIAIKDLICIKGQNVTCGSRILENFISLYDATVIQKLESEDAIVIGKTNMDEFAMGSSNENSYFGSVKNPVSPEHVPGGSSGGSAAAVAAEMVMTALGSDTGGSVRQPAALCGVVGMKPTYGRISRYGLVAFASSLDQIGPFAHTVEDLSHVLNVISGHDPNDSTSANRPVPDFSQSLNKGVDGLKIGIPKEYFAEGLDDDVRTAIENVIAKLKKEGATPVDVSLPHTDYAIATYYIICTAEASSNLARYDGARYGHRAEKVNDLQNMYIESRSEGFGEEVKRRIMLGTYVLSAGYYDAYYLKAQKVRTLIKQDFDNVFHSVDCLITPTSPTPAFKLGDRVDDPLQMYLSDIYTVPMNLAGIPGLSLPCDRSKNGLPIGVQIIGKAFDEEMLIRIGSAIESLEFNV